MQKIKKVPIIGFLENLAHKPIRRDHRFSYYLIGLPLGKEPIKVSHRLNKWRFASGGAWKDIVSLGMLIYGDCNVRSVIGRIKESAAYNALDATESVIPHCHGFSGISYGPIEDVCLLDFLQSKSIPKKIAKRFCRQATLSLGKRKYNAIAFPNSSGGYAIVGNDIRCKILPKDVSVFNLSEDYKLCYLFLTFLDFLSFVALMLFADLESLVETVDIIVLNSASNLDKAEVWLSAYEMIVCCLPNDATGKTILDKISHSHETIYDISNAYAGYRTLNDMLRDLKSAK